MGIFGLNINQQTSGPVEGDRSAMIMTAAVGKILEASIEAAHVVCVDQMKMLVFAARHQQPGSGNQQHAATPQLEILSVKGAPTSRGIIGPDVQRAGQA